MRKTARCLMAGTLVGFLFFAAAVYVTPCDAATAHVVSLHRSDGFSRGIVVSGNDTKRVLIGFTDTPFDDGLFLIQRDRSEAIFQILHDGNVSLISGQQIDLRYILCIVDAVLAFVDDAKSCTQDDKICIARAILGLVIKILNCSEPATTL
ncbi:MAG: hypothetical protein N3B18_10495 [Desulfobacterota bacterium]|nr:hypothetical protein [Thermodesulfobacteriota bacterium]